AALAAEGADVLVLAAAVAPGATAPRGVTVEALPVAGKGADAATRLATDAARAAWLEGRLAAHRSDALHELPAVHTTAGGAPAAVFTGTLRPWHGTATIAEAWRLLGDRAPRLLVVGEGTGQEELEGVGATVTGAVTPDAVPLLLESAHIGLAPYAADTPDYFSPLKVYEYLAAGLA